MNWISKGNREFRAPTQIKLLGGAILVCLALTVPAQPALATFHEVMISEVYPASAAQPQASFLELQEWSPEQNLVGGHTITLYDASGGAIDTFIFPADLPGIGVDQQTMLVGDSGVTTAFGVTPDLVDSDFNIPAGGGAACWDGLDCVSWGNFSGSTSPSSGVPVDAPGIPEGSSIERRISRGTCANRLDEKDDSNDSDTDFFDSAPSPQSYATVPTPPACTAPSPTPVVALDSKPASVTIATSADFAFHATPAATSFECRLDLSAYVACNSGAIAYAGPLSEGLHTFRVRGSNANGTGTSTTYAWRVDLTAPSASLTSYPDDPSPGKSASFRYSSNEVGSKFECRLEPLEPAFANCSTQPKVYLSLADGDYEFLVRAIDPAGNVQSVPTSFPWTVDNSLEDKMPPETTIVSKPTDPSGSPVASFTYSSNEPGSSFQCKLDGGNFNSCPAAGISYSGLAEGAHTFQVRAIDSSNNADLSPAGYSFSVVLGTPAVTGNLAPPALPVPKSSKLNTTIVKAGATTRDRTPTFRFSSSQQGAKFQCKLDAGPYVACRSPFTTKKLTYGKHLLRIRAVLGQASDPTPATLSFKVVKR